MTRLIIPALVALLVSGSAWAEEAGTMVSGNKLLSYCQNTRDLASQGFCLGFIQAAHDSLNGADRGVK